MLHRLENEIQRYAWGSTSALGELYGVENPDREPMAELWMGAHPKAPSRLPDQEGRGLNEYIAENTDVALRAAASHGRLPFLFKILCAQTPLSIQAHPSREQAQEGFAREDAAGIDRGAPNRNYKDDNHKPELICAITDFWALRGFRPVEDIRDEWSTSEFREADSSLAPPETEEDLGRFFKGLLEIPADERRELIAAAVSISQGRWPDTDRAPEPGDPDALFYWVQKIADQYPGDVGILSPLLLNTVSLRPGEVTFQPAGVLHAYLNGVGAELMANSDNVLRGGMTPKHIDPEELMKVGVFRSEPPAILSGDTVVMAGGSRVSYSAPFDEFAFDRYLLDSSPDPLALPDGAPQIVFCQRGTVTLSCDQDAGTGHGAATATLSPGNAAFVDAAASGLVAATGATADSAAELFVARVP